MDCKKIAQINEEGIGRFPKITTAQEIHCVFIGEKPIAKVNINDQGTLNSVSRLIINEDKFKKKFPSGAVRIDATVIYNPNVPDSKYYAYIYTNQKLVSKFFNTHLGSIEDGILLGYSKEDIMGFEIRLQCLNIYGATLTENSPEAERKTKINKCWEQYAKDKNFSSAEGAKASFVAEFNKDYLIAQNKIKVIIQKLKEMDVL